MADKSRIEWTQATWNPIAGCEILSKGCRNCYAMRDAHRLAANPNPNVAAKYEGTTRAVNGRPVWTGRINEAAAATFLQPLRWHDPRQIFVNSMSDLFAAGVRVEAIDKAFAVMALASRMHFRPNPGGQPGHVFQLLTKRPGRAGTYLREAARDVFAWRDRLHDAVAALGLPSECYEIIDSVDFPLPNLWLGTSVEDQATADERIPLLLQTPAAVRWISAEPLLGPVDFYKVSAAMPREGHPWRNRPILGGIDWIVCGGESGPRARPMHTDWARRIRDDCAKTATPFFFKQWGEWLPEDQDAAKYLRSESQIREIHPWPDETASARIGKKAAGRMLDGVTHDAMPEVPGEARKADRPSEPLRGPAGAPAAREAKQ